jgi:hypothetical protein
MHRARGPPRAVEKFSSESRPADGAPPESDSHGAATDDRAGTVDAEGDGTEVLLSLGDETHVLSHAEARHLRERLGDALVRREEFLHTAGEHRPDGSYVVARRRAESAGNRKVFDSVRALERLWKHLPTEFTAEDLGRTGLSGGRRHMVLRHLAEHPAFDCDLVSEQPLTARKGRTPTDPTEVGDG